MKRTANLRYDVTACDDTAIRQVVYSNLTLKEALYQKHELLYAARRHYFNPRIRKHKND